MSSLKVFNIKKSAIKKWFPFKQLLDVRDKRQYNRKYELLKHKFLIRPIDKHSQIVEYLEKDLSAQLLFRTFPFSDLSILYQVFSIQCYAPILTHLKKYFNSDAALRIIDAGANVGYSTLFFHLHFANARIVAIEPEKKNVEQLRENARLNNLSGALVIIEGALWPRKANLKIMRDFRDNREAAFTVEEIKEDEGLQGVTFQSILIKQSWDLIDLFKIDIEGSERFLFLEPRVADELLRKTKFLAIEIHDEFKIRETIYAKMREHNFKLFEYDDLTFGFNTNLVAIPK